MPSDVTPAPAVAYSADAIPAHRGDPSPRGLTTHDGAVHLMGGAGDFLPERCVETKKNGEACQARPVHGTTRCIGHSRSRENTQES